MGYKRDEEEEGEEEEEEEGRIVLFSGPLSRFKT
jgi:hypothetical protein